MNTSRPQETKPQDDVEQLRKLGLAGADPDTKGLLRIKRPGAQQFGGWRGTVVGVVLVAAMTIGYYAGKSMSQVPSPLAVTLMRGNDSEPAAILEIYRNNSIRLVPLAPTEVPAGSGLQLWTWHNDRAIPLALLESAAETTLTGPELPTPQAGQRYAITLEPASSTPHTAPTGVTVLSGDAVLPVR